MTADPVVNAKIAGIQLEEGSIPQSPWTTSSTISLGEDVEITHIMAVNYSADENGQMDFEIFCPEGMKNLRTGWNHNSAYLLSDVTMNGTWGALYLEDNARASAQVLAEWSRTLPHEMTTFFALEPVAGQATLTSSSGVFSCGPSMEPERITRPAFCIHEFSGGKTELEVTQATAGLFGPLGASSAIARTAGAWIGILAQLEYHDWAEDIPHE